MTIARFIHAIYSLLIVYFGYEISTKITSKQNARIIGLILALFWILPFMSVRNLIEVVCIPPLLAAYYLILDSRKKGNHQLYLYAGLIISIAFVFRYQTLIIIGAIGIILLIQMQLKELVLYTTGFITGAFLIQGLTDWIAWDYPFASLYNYIIYNLGHSTSYLTGPWYRYLQTITGVLIPPLSGAREPAK